LDWLNRLRKWESLHHYIEIELCYSKQYIYVIISVISVTSLGAVYCVLLSGISVDASLSVEQAQSVQSLIESLVWFWQVKAAFTRSYNKTIHLTPYSTGAVPKKRGRQAVGDEDDTEDIYDQLEQAETEKRGSDDSDDDISADRMIMVVIAVTLVVKILQGLLASLIS